MAFPSRSSGGGILPWPPGPVYEALIDYNNWFHWFPSMKASRLLMKEESLAIVELVFGLGERSRRGDIDDGVHPHGEQNRAGAGD